MAENRALTQGLGVLGATDEARQRAQRISESTAPLRRGIGSGLESLQRSMSMGPVLGIMDQLSRLGAPIAGVAYEAASPVASALGFEEAGADYDIMGDELRGMLFEPNPIISRMETISGAAADAVTPEKIEPFQMPPEVGMSGSGMTDGRRYSGRGMKVEGATERQDYADAQAAETERDVQRVLSGKMDAEQSASAIQNAFVSAMKEFGQASGKPADTAEMSKEDLLEKYKQEFAEATGVDISGKPDKSAALMAFGLALMQNRAGKGFNVGRILRSVGEAGEAALPKLEAAKSEAKAARLAAGKYALDRIASNRNAKAALALEQQKFAQEAYLKKLELDAKASEGPEIKNVSTIKPIAGLEVRLGTANGRSVWAGGVPAANMIVRSYNSAQKALNTLNEIESSISEVANSPSPSFTLLADRLNTALTGLGLKDPKVAFGEDAVSPEQKANALRNSLVQEFKRFLTQETGNGISNVDVQNILDLLGQMDLIGNPQDAIFRVNQVRGVFEGKISGLTPFIEDLQDPDMYTSMKEYQKVQGIIDSDLGFAPGMKVEISDGVPTVDLTKGS